MSCDCTDFSLPNELSSEGCGDFKAVSLQVRPGILLYEFNFFPDRDVRFSLDLDKDSICLGFIREGQIELWNNTKDKFCLSEKDWVLARMESVYLNIKKENPCDIILLVIDQLTMQAFAKLAGREFENNFGSFICPFLAKPKLIQGQGGKQLVWLSDQIDAHRADNLMGRLELERDVIDLIRLLFSEPKFKLHEPKIPGFSKNTAHKYREIASYLEKNFCDDISIVKLSKKFRISETKLKSEFKLLFGCTVFDYIRDLRFKYAERLICKNELSILEVAFEVGYSNPSHFSQAFKDRYGLLPKAYQLENSGK